MGRRAGPLEKKVVAAEICIGIENVDTAPHNISLTVCPLYSGALVGAI